MLFAYDLCCREALDYSCPFDSFSACILYWVCVNFAKLLSWSLLLLKKRKLEGCNLVTRNHDLVGGAQAYRMWEK